MDTGLRASVNVQSNIRMEGKCDLSGCFCQMGCLSISDTADLLGMSHTTVS